MTIYKGSTPITNLYYGSTAMSQLYVGNTGAGAPIMLEDYESLTGFAFVNGYVNQAIVTSPKIGGSGSLSLETNGTNSTFTATKTLAVQQDLTQMGVVAYPMYFGSDKSQNQVQLQLGRSGTYYSLDNIPSLAGLPTGWRWVAGLVAGSPPSGVAQTELRMRGVAVAPYNMKSNFDRAYKNAKGRPTVVLGFDDGMRTQHDFAFPYMQSKNLVGTVYLPTDLIADSVRISNKMIVPEVQALAAANWAICLDGTKDDSVMVAKANPAACWAEIQTMQAWLAAHGFAAEGGLHFCYPNGYYQGDSGGSPVVPTQLTTVVSDGSNVITHAAATTVAGHSIYGYGIPDGLTVTTGGVGVTSSTLSGTVPIMASRPAATIDKTGEFYLRKLGDYLQAQGMKTGRTTNQDEMYTRFGFGDQQMFTTARTTSAASFATMKTSIDRAVLYGMTWECYIHDINPSGGSINMAEADFTQMIDYIAALRDAGTIEVLTKPQWFARDFGAVAP